MFFNVDPFLRGFRTATERLLHSPKPLRAGEYESAVDELERNALRVSLLDRVSESIEREPSQPFWLKTSSTNSIAQDLTETSRRSAPTYSAQCLNAEVKTRSLNKRACALGDCAYRGASPLGDGPFGTVDRLGEYIMNDGHFDPFGNHDFSTQESPYEPRTRVSAYQPGLHEHNALLDLDLTPDGSGDDYFPHHLRLDKFIEELDEESDGIFSARVSESERYTQTLGPATLDYPLSGNTLGIMPLGFDAALDIQPAARNFYKGTGGVVEKRSSYKGTYLELWDDEAEREGNSMLPGETTEVIPHGDGFVLKKQSSYKGAYLELPDADTDMDSESSSDEDVESVWTSWNGSAPSTPFTPEFNGFDRSFLEPFGDAKPEQGLALLELCDGPDEEITIQEALHHLGFVDRRVQIC